MPSIRPVRKRPRSSARGAGGVVALLATPAPASALPDAELLRWHRLVQPLVPLG